MKKTRIAIFGSSSHIAKGLIYSIIQNGDYSLHLYTTSPHKVIGFLGTFGKSVADNCVIHPGYAAFTEGMYDVVVNCIGIGTLKKHKGDFASYFTITEEFDNLIIGYLLARCPDALYISFSSGAVYGRELSAPADEHSIHPLRVNKITQNDFYAITRINAEAKHRAFDQLRIVDLRVFSYFSRFIDLEDGYLITEIVDCIINKKIFLTDSSNIVRDFIHPADLFSLIEKCIVTGNINSAFDVTSTKPVDKKELLDFFSREYGLLYEVRDSINYESATGTKNIYCSRYLNAASIGHSPRYSSMDVIIQESAHILKKK